MELLGFISFMIMSGTPRMRQHTLDIVAMMRPWERADAKIEKVNRRNETRNFFEVWRVDDDVVYT